MEAVIATLLRAIRSFHVFILDIVFPISCLGCGREGQWLCQTCSRALPRLSEQSCHQCGLPNEQGYFCQHHQPKPEINRVVVAFSYKDKVVKNLIKALKYQGLFAVANDLAGLLLNFLEQEKNLLSQLKGGNFTIMPVPLHRSRLNWRGYNQSEKIALELSKLTGLNYQDKLKKIKKTLPQTGLNRKERLKNLEKAFEWKCSQTAPKNIILVDDLITSGATLNECAKALKKAGAKKIWGITISQNR